MTEFAHVTTLAAVSSYKSSSEIFAGLLSEVRTLSKKKPEATMSDGKVKILNRVLGDLLTFLKDEPEGKYLDTLDDEVLPQVSDAVLVMVQFESALNSFHNRYSQFISVKGGTYWITNELFKKWANEDENIEGDEDDDVF